MFQFDPAQYSDDKRCAVQHLNGPMLVLAVAGSGKTYAITHRIAYLTEVCGIEPSTIVAVSFTNKAARELRSRVAKLIGKDKADRCQLSTFHAMGLEILRKHIDKLGWIKPFAIFGDDDQRRILKNICKDIHLTGPAADPTYLMRFISRVKTHHCNPLDLLPKWNPRRLTYKRIFDDYQSIRQSMNGVDFDDMIALPVELFERFPDVLQTYQETWQYLMIDEYQDTNALQFRLIQLLCGKQHNIMVVGDDDQAIYAFRGAESEHILNFPKMFENVEVVKFEYNFRSTRLILDAANAVIEQNETRYAKSLKTEGEDGEKIREFVCPSPEIEAEFVTEQIQAQRIARSLHYKDFAVLYRTNGQSTLLETAMMRAGIPYRIVNSDSFSDKLEIRDLVFYMRTALSPDDELALRRIINTPRRGIGASTLEHIDLIAKKQHISFFEALKIEAKGTTLTATARMKLQTFIDTIETFHARFAAKTEMLADTMEQLIEAIHFREYIQSSSNNDVQARIRMDNIRELVSQLRLFERTDGRDLMGFLAKICVEKTSPSDDPLADVVTLMTLHSSKGLEFPAVYIIGCEDGLIPHANAFERNDPEFLTMGQTQPSTNDEDEKEDSTTSNEQSVSSLAEERRLFYVGMTRAKKYLTLTRSATRRHNNQTEPSPPSRFLANIPETCIERESATSEAAQRLQKENEAAADNFFAQLHELFK